MAKAAKDVQMFMDIPMTDIFKKCDELKLENRTNESLDKLAQALKIQLKDGAIGQRQRLRLRGRLTGYFRKKSDISVPKKEPSKVGKSEPQSLGTASEVSKIIAQPLFCVCHANLNLFFLFNLY